MTESDRAEQRGSDEQGNADHHEDVDRAVLTHPKLMQVGVRALGFCTSIREGLFARLVPTLASPDEGGVAGDDAADTGADSEDDGTVARVSHQPILGLTRAEWMLFLFALLCGTFGVALAVVLIIIGLSTALSTGAH